MMVLRASPTWHGWALRRAWNCGPAAPESKKPPALPASDGRWFRPRPTSGTFIGFELDRLVAPRETGER